MTLQPRDNGKFQNKSDQPREVRSIRATDQTWIKLGDCAESRSITRADLLEELADKLNNESAGQSKILTAIELAIITTTLQECLNLKGNATSKIKTKLNSILNMLVENAD
jgi:predicted DNA-binding ribbon-helix-helix protein